MLCCILGHKKRITLTSGVYLKRPSEYTRAGVEEVVVQTEETCSRCGTNFSIVSRFTEPRLIEAAKKYEDRLEQQNSAHRSEVFKLQLRIEELTSSKKRSK